MLFEAIERPFRGDDNYDKPYDLSLEQTAMIIKVKTYLSKKKITL